MQKKKSKQPTYSSRQKNELRFIKLWEQLETGIELKREILGIIPGRRFKYDFQIGDYPVLVEINGGTYSKGKTGHNSGKGLFRDAFKVNGAQYNGYYIFVFTVDMLKLEYIRELHDYVRTLPTE